MASSIIKEEMQELQETEAQNSLQEVIDKVKAATITDTNYEEWQNKLENIQMIVNANIERDIYSYREEKNKYKELLESEDIKDSMKSDFVPKEVFEALRNGSRHFKQMFNWLAVQNELLLETQQKLFKCIGAYDGIKIKDSVLKEFKETEEKRSEFMKEVLTTRMSEHDTLLHNTIKGVVTQNNEGLSKIMDRFQTILDSLNRQHLDTIRHLDKALQEKMLGDMDTASGKKPKSIHVVDRIYEEDDEEDWVEPVENKSEPKTIVTEIPSRQPSQDITHAQLEQLKKVQQDSQPQETEEQKRKRELAERLARINAEREKEKRDRNKDITSDPKYSGQTDGKKVINIADYGDDL
jgi:hypothetical protein